MVNTTQKINVMDLDSDPTIEVVRDLAGVSALRGEWQAMSIEADIDFYTTIVQCRSHSTIPLSQDRGTIGDVLRPHVIVLKRQGAIRSILAGRLEKKNLDVTLGYKTLHLPSARCLTLIPGGLMGESSDNCAAALMESIQESLIKGEADVVWFYGLDVNSVLYRIARQAGGLLTRDYFPREIQRWKLKLPPSYEELYRGLSSSTRHNLRRYPKRLCDAFGEQMKIKTYQEPSDLEWILSDTEAVAAKTYHRGLGVGFVNNEETRRSMSLAANRGWLRAYILYIAGKPQAFWNGLLYHRTFFTSTTGYDPDLRDYHPGTFLLQKMLQDLCSERAADEVDFGFGYAQYKRDLCKHGPLQTSSLLLFAPTPKGISLNFLRTPLIGVANGARRVFIATGMMQGLKRAWRDRVTPKKG